MNTIPMKVNQLTDEGNGSVAVKAGSGGDNHLTYVARTEDAPAIGAFVDVDVTPRPPKRGLLG